MYFYCRRALSVGSVTYTIYVRTTQSYNIVFKNSKKCIYFPREFIFKNSNPERERVRQMRVYVYKFIFKLLCGNTLKIQSASSY